jgi:hypothetical protein
MKKSANKQVMAKAVRRIAKRILQETSEGAMRFGKLCHAVKEEIPSLRNDFFSQCISTLRSDMVVNMEDGIVFLKGRKIRKEKIKMAKEALSTSNRRTKKKADESKQLSTAEFTLLAIKKLKGPKYKAIHSVYSGFNNAFRDYFPGLDPVEEVTALAKKGIVSIRMIKGGALIYPSNTAPPDVTVSSTLKKMGLV